jgi:hypothetical protein
MSYLASGPTDAENIVIVFIHSGQFKITILENVKGTQMGNVSILVSQKGKGYHLIDRQIQLEVPHDPKLHTKSATGV